MRKGRTPLNEPALFLSGTSNLCYCQFKIPSNCMIYPLNIIWREVALRINSKWILIL